MRRTGSGVLSVILLLILMSGCTYEQLAEPISETRLMLNTFCTITIHGNPDRAVLAEAFDLCAEYEKLLSITEQGSDVWRINHAGGAPVTVAPQTAEIIKAGLEYGELSGGMFDITIGRLSTLWDFTGESGVPSEADIYNALETVDYRQVVLNGNTVQLLNPEAWIDLGGIAKGYIADMAASFLKERGVESAIVDLGGNIVTVGQKPDGSPWRIGITKPFSDRKETIGYVETGEASVVSSGIYERQFVENGEVFHHILNPFTGMPVRSDVVGATVLSDESMFGDALSTIIPLVGSERAWVILTELTGVIGAVLILENGEVLVYGDIELKGIN